ncbi:PREDICTED: cyclin-K-like [Papilio polytes]|uniref:cyclin-K-like n=1 Tax=Papilio polytes TaxID=76194 RepID=UPI0006765FB6|nr:PREDICTED: cyclin-K-like [Papilio polytes]
MPYWYYDKKDLQNTPSFRDGISTETENRYRKEGARFIIDTGSKMDLGYNTVATGVVYFHRFYMFHSFKTFPRYITACCCLFLAGKVEETPKKCKDIIKVAKPLISEQKFSSFGDDPKEEVMTLERILLQTIKFDLQVEHPYGYLLKYAKCLKGDKSKLQKMVQMAWTFVNDSLCTTLCLQWEPEVIAVALMFLAGKLSKFEIVDWNGRTPKHNAWWDMFVEDITTDLLEDICHQVLDLYSPQTQQSGGDSPNENTAKQPKNEKKPPSVTPPASASPVAAVASKPVTTPLKNGGETKPEPPKMEPLRFTYPSYPGIPFAPPVYSAPPPGAMHTVPAHVPHSVPPTHPAPPMHPIPPVHPPPPHTVPPHTLPPLSYREPPPSHPRFGAPVSVPPPNYFPPMPTRGPLHRTLLPGPPPRPYYPPP